MPVRFICRTKKHEKVGGFSDHTQRVKPEKGAISTPSEEKYTIKPEEYASLALVHFDEGGHDDLKV